MMFLTYGRKTILIRKQINEKEAYKSENYRNTISRLEYLKEIKGIGIITGVTGIGKTYCVRCFKEKLNKDLYKIIYVSATKLTVFEFLNALCKELGLDVGNCYRNEVENKIQKTIKKLKLERHQETIIIIDNAENLDSKVIMELKYLYEFDMDSIDYISIVLIGTVEIKDELRKSKYEAFQQRVILQYNMEGLTREETKEYIVSRLKLSGQEEMIFTDNAINALYNVSGGNIRKLNNLIITSMMIGYQKRLKVMNEDIIRLAKEENEI